ncbi:phosphoesterase, DHHA1, partial [candidate division TM7 genomosp. GTL1]
DTLLSKTLEIPGGRAFLQSKPVLVFDHHGDVEASLPFDHTLLVDEHAVATSEALYRFVQENDWAINQQGAEHMLIAILADSLGFTTPNTTAESLRVASELVELGADPADIEGRRREFMKKSPEILAYKGKLIERIKYALDGTLAMVHIPWEDIQAYSDQYNPSVLVLDEMRMVNGVEVAVAIKTYPDGKLTGKLRTNVPIAEKIAGFFGGGGHKYAAGFRVYEEYDIVYRELITAIDKLLKDYHGNVDTI